MRQDDDPELASEATIGSLTGHLAQLVKAIHEERDPLRRALLEKAFHEPIPRDRLFPEAHTALPRMPTDPRTAIRAPQREPHARARSGRGGQARAQRGTTRRPLMMFAALGGRRDYAFRPLSPDAVASITFELGPLGCAPVDERQAMRLEAESGDDGGKSYAIGGGTGRGEWQ